MSKKKRTASEVKRERAARRAKKRREAAELAADRALIDAPLRVEMPLPPGAEHVPRSAAQDHGMSEALLEVMRPFVPWPPAPAELKPFAIMLEVTAAVWNASLSADEVAREAALDDLATSLSIGALSPSEARAFVGEIAARKLALYPSDRRLVVEHRVRLDGNQLLVTAASAHRSAPHSAFRER